MGRLADELHSIPPATRQGEPCLVQQALDGMDAEDRTDFEDMLRQGGTVGARRISAALSAIGVSVSGTAINEHRGRICRCYKVVSRG